MKHIKLFENLPGFEGGIGQSNQNMKNRLNLRDVKIWTPTKVEIGKLVDAILLNFKGSEIVSVSENSIKVKQGDVIKEGSPVDWCMGINQILTNEGEGVMSLFFWQGNSPVDDLLYSITK